MGAMTLVLLLALTQPSQDCGELVRCEELRRANLDAALVWESRAHESRAAHRACLARLEVRTSTPTPAVVRFEAIDSGPSPAMLALGGTALVLVGVIGGILAALAVK